MKIEIEVTQAYLNNNSITLPRDDSFFPKDSWGGKNKEDLGQLFKVEFSGTAETVNTDIDGKKRTLRNARGQLGRFYKLYDLKAGDRIYIEKTGPREFKVNVDVATLSSVNTSSTKVVGNKTPSRKDSKTSSVARIQSVTNHVKDIYSNKCQVCGLALKVPGGTYSEGAHIKPLGEPHNGPDIPENVLCLCPNHHKMFDKGSLYINDDYSLVGVEGVLTVSVEHAVGIEYIRYHREKIA